MRLAQLGSPEAPPDGHDGQLSHDDGATDGGGHLGGQGQEVLRFKRR